MIQLVSPRSQWHVALGFEWHIDVSFHVRALAWAVDHTLHVQSFSVLHALHIDGFMVETGLVVANHMVYMNAWREQRPRIYLYHHPSLPRWMIGST